MTDANDLPVTTPTVVATDISVDRIALRSCRFDDHLFEQAVLQVKGASDPPASPVAVNLATTVSVWVNEEQKFALVRLVIEAKPETQPTWTATVEVVGKYSCGANPVIPLQRFAWNNGIAYLVPYARERLASLTAASVFATYVLPPLNVAKLIELSKAPTPKAEAEISAETKAQE